jgi:hypothetical protein
MASTIHEWKDGVVNEKLQLDKYRLPYKQLRNLVRQPFTMIDGKVLEPVAESIQERLDSIAEHRCVHEVPKGIASDVI